MKKGKNRLRQIMALAVALVVIASSMNVPSAMSYAKEATDIDGAVTQENGENKGDSVTEDVTGDAEPKDLEKPAAEEQKEPEEQADTAAEEDLEQAEDSVQGTEEQQDTKANEEDEAAEEEIIEETVDLSEYIYQCGGFGVLDEPKPMRARARSAETRAAADMDGAKNALVQGLSSRQSSISLEGYNIPETDLKALFSDTLNSNPGLFYVGGGFSYYVAENNTVKSITPQYVYPEADVQAYNAALEKAYREAVPDAAGMNEMQIARACHDYLAQHMYYDFSYSKYNAYNALVEGTAVCQGYSLAYGAMLQKAGIAFDYTTSDVMNHMWNYVRIDNNWYHVDVTWDDPMEQEEAPADRKGFVSHRYFLNSDAKIGSEGAKGHRGWVQGKSCTSTVYDNEFWQGNVSAIFRIAGKDYYLKYPSDTSSTTVELICRENNSERRELSFESEWKADNGRWYGTYSTLSYYNDKLYFNDTKNIYSFNPNVPSAEKKLVYEYTEGAGDLYGSLICDDKIMMTVSTSPYIVTNVKEELLPTGDIQSVTAALDTSAAEYGYTTNPVMTAVVAKQDGVTGTPEFIWYRMKEEGSLEQLSSTEATCSVEPGLSVGTYIYRVVVTLNDDTISRDITFTVIPKTVTPTITVQDADSYKYNNGEPVIPGFQVSVDGAALVKDVDYTVEYENNVNAGTGIIVVKAVEGRNYTWTPERKEFEIQKADKGTDNKTAQARYGNQAVLALELPEGAVVGELTVSDPDSVLADVPSVTDGSLAYAFVNDEGKVGNQAVITIPVTDSTNYNPYEIKVTVKVTAKEPQTDFKFLTSPENRTYGEDDFVAATTGAVKGSKVTYSIEDTKIATVDNTGKVHIKKPGTTKIIAVASETSEYAKTQISCDLNVNKAVLSWTNLDELFAADRADNETGDKKKTADATLYGRLQVSGIVNGDDVIFDCTADKLTGTYVNVAAGDQDVKLSWKETPVTLAGADADNYMLPESLPTVKGKITRIIIQPLDIESEDGTKFQLEIETGITEVPESLKDSEKWDTILKINNGMKAELTEILKSIPDENKVVYDVKLMVNVDGKGWVEATEENFPKDGLKITIPYPEGTGKDTHNFVAAHLFTTSMNGYKAGDVEQVKSSDITKLESGLQFTVHGLSPVAIGWEEIARSTNTANSTTGNRSTTSTAPRTGDENAILLYVILMAMSAVSLNAIRKRRISEGRKRDLS